VWHYEYAIYNQNLDRGIQSFSVPMGAGVSMSNVGFHAPPQHPGWSADGTVGNAGYSSTPWTQTNLEGGVQWGAESFAQNPNANAIRWGTMYNIRFDSNRPPTTVNATIGFFKTGSPITVAVQGPAPAVQSNVTVGGRLTNQAGLGIGGVAVVMQGPGGSIRYAISSPFGYYFFDGVATGLQYTFSTSSKRYNFGSGVTITVNDNLSNVDFIEQ
jgi:hypothetical protein